MCEIDLVNAFYAVICKVLPVPEEVQTFKTNRETLMAQMVEYFVAKSGDAVGRDAVKELFL